MEQLAERAKGGASEDLVKDAYEQADGAIFSVL